MEPAQWFILRAAGKAPRATLKAWNVQIRGALADKSLQRG
jgi:hypothetical protein